MRTLSTVDVDVVKREPVCQRNLKIQISRSSPFNGYISPLVDTACIFVFKAAYSHRVENETETLLFLDSVTCRPI